MLQSGEPLTQETCHNESWRWEGRDKRSMPVPFTWRRMPLTECVVWTGDVPNWGIVMTTGIVQTLIFPYTSVISAHPTNWAHYHRHGEGKKISPHWKPHLLSSFQIKTWTAERRHSIKGDTDEEMRSRESDSSQGGFNVEETCIAGNISRCHTDCCVWLVCGVTTSSEKRNEENT